MRKEHTTSSVASSNLSQHFNAEKQSFLDQFINWFRNFVENAE